jgi:hypothetical protein
MYTNVYLAEKLTSMHRDDLLREVAGERMKAQLPHSHTHLGWRVATTVGTLLIRVGSWLERSAQHDERMMLDT